MAWKRRAPDSGWEVPVNGSAKRFAGSSPGEKLCLKLLLSNVECKCIGEGAVLQEISSSTGAELYLSGQGMFYPGSELQELNIQGLTQEAILTAAVHALSQISEMVGYLACDGPELDTGGARVKLVVPAKAAHVIIGPKGEAVKQLKHSTGIGCSIDLQTVPPDSRDELAEQALVLTGPLSEMHIALSTISNHLTQMAGESWYPRWVAHSNSGVSIPGFTLFADKGKGKGKKGAAGDGAAGEAVASNMRFHEFGKKGAAGDGAAGEAVASNMRFHEFGHGVAPASLAKSPLGIGITGPDGTPLPQGVGSVVAGPGQAPVTLKLLVDLQELMRIKSEVVEAQTGAQLMVSGGSHVFYPGTQLQEIVIQGPSEEVVIAGVVNALNMIAESSSTRSITSGEFGVEPEGVRIHFILPIKAAKAVIGVKGSNVAHIRQSTSMHVHVEQSTIPPSPVTDLTEQVVSVSGAFSGVPLAVALISQQVSQYIDEHWYPAWTANSHVGTVIPGLMLFVDVKGKGKGKSKDNDAFAADAAYGGGGCWDSGKGSWEPARGKGTWEQAGGKGTWEQAGGKGAWQQAGGKGAWEQAGAKGAWNSGGCNGSWDSAASWGTPGAGAQGAFGAAAWGPTGADAWGAPGADAWGASGADAWRAPGADAWSSRGPGAGAAPVAGKMGLKLLVASAEGTCIVGQGGKSIREIGQTTFTKLTLSDRNAFYPGTHLQELRVLGSGPETVVSAVMLALAQVSQAMGAISGGDDGVPPGDARVKVVVPVDATKVIIGKSGSNVKRLRDESGMYVHVEEIVIPVGAASEVSEQVVCLSGPITGLQIALPMIAGWVAEVAGTPAFAAWASCSHAGLHCPGLVLFQDRKGRGKGKAGDGKGKAGGSLDSNWQAVTGMSGMSGLAKLNQQVQAGAVKVGPGIAGDESIMAVKLLFSEDESSTLSGPGGTSLADLAIAIGCGLTLSDAKYPGSNLRELIVQGSSTSALLAGTLQILDRLIAVLGMVTCGEINVEAGGARLKLVVPSKAATAVIGVGGAVVKQLRQQCGVGLSVDSTALPCGGSEVTEQAIHIRGSVAGVNMALQTVFAQVEELCSEPWFTDWASHSNAGVERPGFVLFADKGKGKGKEKGGGKDFGRKGGAEDWLF